MVEQLEPHAPMGEGHAMTMPEGGRCRGLRCELFGRWSPDWVVERWRALTSVERRGGEGRPRSGWWWSGRGQVLLAGWRARWQSGARMVSTWGLCCARSGKPLLTREPCCLCFCSQRQAIRRAGEAGRGGSWDGVDDLQGWDRDGCWTCGREKGRGHPTASEGQL